MTIEKRPNPKNKLYKNPLLPTKSPLSTFFSQILINKNIKPNAIGSAINITNKGFCAQSIFNNSKNKFVM